MAVMMGIKKYIKAAIAGAIKDGLNEDSELRRQLIVLQEQIKHENEENRLNNLYLSLPGHVLDFFYRGQEINFFLPNANIDGIQKQILRTKTFYEVAFLEKLYEYIKDKKGVAIDAGANIGNHSIFFSKVCNFSSCYAIEPNPAVSHILQRNIEINDLDAKVHRISKGIGAENGHMFLGVSPQDNLGATKLQKEGFIGTEIDVIALDQLDLRDVDLIKIDLEGMAIEALIGAEKTIVQNQPVLFVELFDDEFKAGQTFLAKLGYELKCSLPWGNYIFTRVAE